MKTQAQFTFSKVNHDQENDVHLVVSLTAPKMDWEKKRPSVCITLVADVSGSMGGSKLDYAKQSMLKLIDHLQPGDYCGLVTFESSVVAISPPMEMTQARKDDLKAKVGSLHPLGGTNFSGGMLQGLEYANKADLPSKVVNRIIMFTDGQANQGVATQREDLVKLLTANLGKATLSAFGYGSDADQEMLADVAKFGKGNYAFIKNPDDAMQAFAKELGGLLSTYAQNIEVTVAPRNGHKVTEVVSDVDATDGEKVVIRIPDILSEEERHLVLKLRLAKQPQALPREMSAVDVDLTYDLISESGKKASEKTSVKAKIRFVKPGDEQASPTPEVDKLVALARMVKAQIEAEQLAKAGNYGAAVNVMSVFSAEMATAGHTGVSTASANIGSHLADNSVYTASSGYLNCTRSGGTRGMGLSGGDNYALEALEGAGVKLSNKKQESLVKDWTASQPAPSVNPGQPWPALQGQASGPVQVLSPFTFTPVPAAFTQPLIVPTLTLHPPQPPAPEAPKPEKSKSVSKARSKRW